VNFFAFWKLRPRSWGDQFIVGSTALMFACDKLTASLWRVDCVTSRTGDELTCDELTVWRADRVTSWPCDELTGSQRRWDSSDAVLSDRCPVSNYHGTCQASFDTNSPSVVSVLPWFQIAAASLKSKTNSLYVNTWQCRPGLAVMW